MKMNYMKVCNALLFIFATTLCAIASDAPVLKPITMVKASSEEEAIDSFEDKLDQLLMDEDLRFRLHIKSDRPVYYAGETIRLAVCSEADAYLYIFGVNTQTEQITLLFPNHIELKEGKIKGDEAICIPDRDANFELGVIPPFGEEVVVALATKEPITFESKAERVQFARFLTKIRSGETPDNGLVTLKAIIAQPKRSVSPGDWSIASIRFRTVGTAEESIVSAATETPDSGDPMVSAEEPLESDPAEPMDLGEVNTEVEESPAVPIPEHVDLGEDESLTVAAPETDDAAPDVEKTSAVPTPEPDEIAADGQVLTDTDEIAEPKAEKSRKRPDCCIQYWF